jgi:hypothetical protein
MNAVDRLDAAKVALDAARAEYDAALDGVLTLARETGASQFRSGRYTIAVATRREVSPERLLEWTRERHPDQLEQAVRPAFRKAFVASLRWDDGEPVTPDGEVIDWAGTTTYLSVRRRTDV